MDFFFKPNGVAVIGASTTPALDAGVRVNKMESYPSWMSLPILQNSHTPLFHEILGRIIDGYVQN
jgi:hypothetical protein